jgi:LacI family transcriptional regulator
MTKLNITKIAELAGVSKATVSRVLNDYSYVSDEIREKVMKVVQETGYERNYAARILASKRSNLIGLVIPTGAKAVFSDPYYPKLTEGISRAANQHRQTLSLFLFDSEQDGVNIVQDTLKNGLFDGLLVTGDRMSDRILPMLIESSMPYVLMGRTSLNGDVSFIDVDNISGGRKATNYLIERGYQRIGIITCGYSIAGIDRFEGYKQALEASGIALNKDLVAYGDFTMDSAYEAMQQLLPCQPDAVFAVSDTMGLGAIRAINEAGLRVPDDIGIIGFDDLPPAVQANPPLTTIRQPIHTQGKLAVETLLELLESPHRPPRQIELPVQLVVRASTK